MNPPAALRPPASGSRASRGSAFTLVELMVAGTITTLLLLGMTGVFDQSMKAWRQSSRRGDAEREIRATLAQIRRDFSGLVVSSNYPIYYNISRLSNQHVSIPEQHRVTANAALKSGPQNADWSNASVVLFFASVQPAGTPDAGQVAGIGYFVTFDTNANQGLGAWNLYRRYQTPADLLQGVQARLANPTIGPYHINSISNAEVIGANVFNFWASFVDLAVTNTATITNTRPISWPTNFNSLATGTNFTTRPKYVQLELTAYGSEQAAQFQDSLLQNRRVLWFNTTNIQRFGRSYIWRVDL